jgi:hypothetical protein
VFLCILDVTSTDHKHSSHGSEHFSPAFAFAIRQRPRNIDLPPQDWEEALRPLSILRHDLLKLPSLKQGYCNKCTLFQLIDDLIPESDPESDRQADFSLNFGRFTFGLAAIVALGLAWPT